MQKQELAVLTTSDLQAAGINSQLSSNDLVEVVAHDIYNKYLDSVHLIITQGDNLVRKYFSLFDNEVNKMKLSLSKYLRKESAIEIVADADYVDEDYEGVQASFGKMDEYWHQTCISKVKMIEKDKGTLIDSDYRNVNLPSLKAKMASVKITLGTGSNTTEEEIKIGNISGQVTTSTQKAFTQIIKVPVTRFKQFADEVKQHNENVKELLKFLPKNGVLSVERFTRDARVKMNKKIISAQSPDFRKKISELFNIKL